MERIRTGITGLDKLLGGGIVPGSNIIVKGTPGTGKTTLGMQYLINGVKKYSEPGIYLSTSQEIGNVVAEFDGSDFKIAELAKDPDKLLLSQFSEASFRKKGGGKKALQPKDLVEAVNFFLRGKTQYTRLVIDSVSTLTYNYSNPNEMRHELDRVFNFTKSKGLTTVYLTENASGNAPFGFEDFLADGLIELTEIEDKKRRLRRGVRVIKQRGSKIDRVLREYKITRGGIDVYPEEEMFV
ncbi:MAG: hypothetical protein KAW41_00370 [Candidatus Diapherotrites archaeon]|nr:hypothetical protein [Candidatus Diapherotrites archaeon]